GMERDLDAVVGTRESLVDGVVDDLVHEVMEAADAGRADIHPRPEPDGLEPLQNGDVLRGVGAVCFGLGHEKSPANPTFAGAFKCIRTSGRSRFARGSSRRPSSRSSAGRRRRVGLPIPLLFASAPPRAKAAPAESQPVAASAAPATVRARTSARSPLPSAAEFPRR